MSPRCAVLALLLFLVSIDPYATGAETKTQVVVGSKKFTESVILGEIIALRLDQSGLQATHKRQLGGTRVLFNALRARHIDCYAEYTGTILREILASYSLKTQQQARKKLTELGIGMSRPLGFNNTYAIGMKQEVAERLGIETISDLAHHSTLSLGFTNEFMDRADGWPGLRRRYELPQERVRGLDHDLAYRGLNSGDIHVTDLYSTDAEIHYYRLKILRDDRHFFQDYHAVILFRYDMAHRHPAFLRTVGWLEGRIGEKDMIRMNTQAKFGKIAEPKIAAGFLEAASGMRTQVRTESGLERILRHTGEHLTLVAISLFAAILVALPLGIVAVRRPRLGQSILAVVGVIQTIPSLALLVFMIPLLGIGGPPAIMALFLYSLLPIVRNTHAGLRDIPLEIRESAQALGLPPGARLRMVELPLAIPSILAGVKTSAVINVGTATLGALIGAGGYGQPILTGIRLDDVSLILQGAIPAALLALLVQWGFDGLDRVLVPRGLRMKSR